VVEQEVERMGGLVADLPAFSRRGVDRVSTVDVREELTKSLDLVQHQARRRGIGVVKELAADTPAVYADRQKVRQVFLNLLTNACDAMAGGGTLTLRSGQARLAGGGPAALVEVSDTGVGIAAEHLARVMEPFFTTKEEGRGTGLGLAICRRIVQEHGGAIRLASAPGKGTTVQVTLPAPPGPGATG
jgi:signal transduction histidine kinase